MNCSRPVFTMANNTLMGKQVAPFDDLGIWNIGKQILNTLKQRPDFVAQVHAETGRKITFEEILDRSVKLAIWMKEEEVYPGDLIAICTSHHVGLYVFFACLYIGAVPIMQKYKHRVDYDVSYDFMRINPKIIFVDKLQYHETEHDEENTFNNITKDMVMAPSVIVIDSSKCLYNKHCFNYNTLVAYMDKYYDKEKIKCFSCTELDMYRLKTLAIIYTRGINDLPKAVKISHKVILSPIHQEVMSMLADTVGMWVGPIFLFPNLLLAIHSILSLKRTIIFEGNDIKKIWATIKKYEVNWVRLETYMCQAILDSEDYINSLDISCLKTLMFSGSVMKYRHHIDLRQLFPESRVLTLYGIMETGIIAYQKYDGKPGSCGYIGKNVNLMITDATRTPLSFNTPGKIWVNCWGMPDIYYDINDTLSIRKINNKGWFDTGDVGYYDEDGEIYVINRIVDFIQFEEFSFSPTIIENIIKEQEPGVDEVAIVAKRSDMYKQIPVAYITVKKDQEVKEQDILHITNNLRNCMRLRGGVIVLEKMPHEFFGNIDRNCLRRKVQPDEDFRIPK